LVTPKPNPRKTIRFGGVVDFSAAKARKPRDGRKGSATRNPAALRRKWRRERAEEFMGRENVHRRTAASEEDLAGDFQKNAHLPG
jgi:hypothetical protein